MPPLETSARYQHAVLWTFAGEYDSYGQRKVNAPSEIHVRWEWVWRDVPDARGNTVTIEAEVTVDADAGVGSLLYLGTLDEWYGTGSGGDNNGLVEVVRFKRVPDVKNRTVRRVLECRRFRNALPPSA